MKYPDFVGGTYSGRSLTPASDRCQNLYPESTKGAGSPENNFVLQSTPGHKLENALPLHPTQFSYEEPATGRVFAVAGGSFFEVAPTGGGSTNFGPIDGGPYTMASNAQQIMITCRAANSGWIFTLNTNVLVKITSPGFLGSDKVVMIDNYFVVATKFDQSRQFQISALLDGLTWDALDVGFAEGGPDNLRGMEASHRELWLMGSQHMEIFVDTGNNLFPFERINETYIEMGIAASDASCVLDNTIYWLGSNEQGHCRFFKAVSYTPSGVSTRSTEWFFNQYAKHDGGIADARLYGYQDEDGHSFAVLTFPSATVEPNATGGVTEGVIDGATWVYDVTENQWHERFYLNPDTGKHGRDLGLYHCFGFGKHLVGGGDDTGNIYSLDIDTYLSNSNPILRVRVAPHIVDELKWIRYNSFQLSAQVGTGPVGDPFNSVMLRVSNDGGLTWSSYYTKSLGDAGQYMQNVKWKMLGRAQRRAFEVSTTIKSQVAWVDAFLETTEGR